MTTFLNTRVKVLASHYQLPEAAYSTEEMLDILEKISGSRYARAARRIASHIGIEHRHLCRDMTQAVSAPSPTNSELVAEAVSHCLNEANLQPDELDYLIGHTSTPDTQVPPGIAWVADRLDYHGLYLELRQACTGFASGLQMALPRIENQHKPVMITGSETGSVYFDHAPEFLDQSQLVNYLQMGDGAGAVLLGPDTGEARGVISDAYMGQIGVGKFPGLMLDGGSASVYTQPGRARFHHDAAMVKKQGEALFHTAIEALAHRGLYLEDFDYIIPHQASGHIDTHFSQATGIPKHKIINDARTLGNLGSAAIWVSFARLRESGVLNPGDRVLVIGAESTKYMYGGFVYTH